MAEEFQAGICGGTAAATTWWNPSRNTLSPCSVAGFGFMNDHHHHLNQMGSYGWSSSSSSDYDHIVDLKSSSSNNNNSIVTTRSSNCDQESNNSVVTGESSVIFQKTTDSDSGGNSSILMDSAFNMMGGYGGLPSSSTSSPTDWNHALLRENVRVAEENNYGSLIHDDMINNHDPSSSSSTVNISQGLFGYPSSLLQGLLEPDHQTQIQHQQQQQSSLFSNQRPSINNFLSTTVPASPCWSKPTAAFQKQQPNNLQFTNSSTTPFWNTSSSTTTGFYPSSQPQTLSPTVGSKPNNYSSLTTKCNNNREEGTVVKKASTEPAFKRPRIETPSPLPTFKVRKEKLGDRITALQQLVSPFGKTDTASVLHEAIEYIKLLHDQVSVLSTPYMKQGNPIQQQQQQQGSEKLMKETDAPNQDLRSRGLCLVPISSTFPVANETTPDFWMPTFGGTFR